MNKFKEEYCIKHDYKTILDEDEMWNVLNRLLGKEIKITIEEI